MNNYKQGYTALVNTMNILIRFDLDLLDKYARKELEESIQHLYKASMLLKLLHEEQI